MTAKKELADAAKAERWLIVFTGGSLFSCIFSAFLAYNFYMAGMIWQVAAVTTVLSGFVFAIFLKASRSSKPDTKSDA